MLSGVADALPELNSEKDFLLPEEFDEDEEDGSSSQILYMTSFDELANSYLKYDSIIWLSISLLLVLAWGVGAIMLLYLPYKRYVLWKDINSRKLYVTPTEIVYKVTRPSYVPFWREAKFEMRVPLSLVIDIIIEQGCLQSIYGLHTIRIESISCGKTAPVDDLQVQGVFNPGYLRKIIISEAAKVVQESGRTLKIATRACEGGAVSHPGSLYEGAAIFRSPSKNLRASSINRSPSIVSGDLLLYKVDELNRSVKIIESLMEKSRVPSTRAAT